MEEYFLGIDVGSTAVKVVVINKGVSLHQISGQLTTYYQSSNGAQYQKAPEILQVIENLLLNLPNSLRKKVTAIGFSVAMHSLMPVVGSRGSDVFLWSDQQAAQIICDLPKKLAKNFYQKTGTPIHPMSPFAKILYFQQAKSYPSETCWWGLKELLMQFFTGKVAVDIATASATGMCSLATGDWDQEILDYLEITRQQLAPIVPVNQEFALTESCQKQFGFSKRVRVFCGGSDGCLAAYAGLATTGIANSLTIGTSAALRSIGPEIKLDSQRQTFCYRLTKELFVSGGPSNNGGNVLAWGRHIFGERKQDFYRQLPDILAQTPIGANGVKFYPFLSGERAPYWNAQMTGGFQHLRITTKRQEMIRSLLEGLLLNLRTLKPAVLDEGTVTFSGGFFETAELAQLTVDILGNPAVLAQENEPVYGLYYLLFASQQNASIKATPPQMIVPNPEASRAYENLHQDYFGDLS